MSRLATFRQRRAREERSLRLVPSFALAARSAETVRSFKPRPFVFRRAVDDESLRILLVDRQVWASRDCFVPARPRRCTVMLGYFPRALLLASIIFVSSGCASFRAVDGVDNLWREVPVDQFQRGVTKQADVLELLGPPSQLISLHDQTVFYYLTERTSGEGKIFLVWNQVSAESEYDRAIFFFDTDGVLQEVAYSKEEIVK